MLIILITTFANVVAFACIVSQEIEEVDTDEHYRPKSWIGITDVTLEQKI